MIQSVNKYHIYEIFAADGKFYYSIPKYQREYTWSSREWDALYEDISENNIEYFIGAIICIPLGDSINPYMEVIDGQQRLTTISLFLAAIYSYLKDYKEDLNEDDEDTLPSLRKSLRSSIAPNEMKIYPQIQNHNLDDYNFIMSDLGLKKAGSPKPSYFSTRKIARCYNHFKNLLNNEIKELETEKKIKLLLERYEKIKHAMLVKIEVSSHSDAYVLFESLNNRGTPLTAIDLMKNLIMAKAECNGFTSEDCFNRWQQLLSYLSDDYNDQERFFRQYYNAFKHTLNKPFKSETDRKNYPLGGVATKSNLLNIYEKLINKNLDLFLTEILECGKYYSWLILQNNEDNPFKKELEDLDHIQGAAAYLLLMYVIKFREELQLSDNHINKLISLLTKYFVRRNITDYPSTRELVGIFMDIIAKIEEQEPKGDKVLELIIDILREKNNCASDKLFRESLEGDIYKENGSAARFILCKLAEIAMTNETWTDLWKRTDQKKYIWTIEHIFPEGDNIPQSWIDMIAEGDSTLAKNYLSEYTHKIGNLTITGYNSTLGNKSFQEKRDRKNKDGKFIGYKNGLEINKDIELKETWTIKDIEERSEKLVNKLIELYQFPS